MVIFEGKEYDSIGRFVIFADGFSEFEVLIRKEFSKEIEKAVQDITNNIKLGLDLIIK